MRLKELRKSKGLTQREMAAIFNVGKSTYSYWEMGSFEPNLEMLTKLSEYFNVTVDFLLGRTAMPNKPIEQGSIEEVKIELKRLGIDNNLEAQASLLRKINNLTEEQKQLILMMIGNFKE